MRTRIRIKVISWIRIRPDLHQFANDMLKFMDMSLFEHFFKGLRGEPLFGS